MSRHAISRRHFLGALGASLPLLSAARAVAAAPAPGGASGSVEAALRAPRALIFAHTHTGEHLDVEYFRDGAYVPDALHSVNHFLRDFRTGDIHPIDPGLLDLLHHLTAMTEARAPFQVISGYRSPATNAMLRHRSEGVASGSLHMQGQAIDIRLADVPLPLLRKAALAAGRGGVGYYPASDFVHVDTGRVRHW